MLGNIFSFIYVTHRVKKASAFEVESFFFTFMLIN